MNTNLQSLDSVAGTNELRDIRPPVEIPSGWAWVAWVLGVLLVLAIAYLLWRWWRRRQAAVPTVPQIPAHVRARQELEAALALIREPKPFCTRVSDTVRVYLEERFQFRAPERTTEEFLHELRGIQLLLPDQKETLGEFLRNCDLVKFARYEPREPELFHLHAAALRLVDETAPVEEPAPGANAGSPEISRTS